MFGVSLFLWQTSLQGQSLWETEQIWGGQAAGHHTPRVLESRAAKPGCYEPPMALWDSRGSEQPFTDAHWLRSQPLPAPQPSPAVDGAGGTGQEKAGP